MTSLTEIVESTCYVCQQTTTRIVWREGSYEGRRCACGLTYTHPSPPPDSVDETVNLHPDEFYSDAASFKADWVVRQCGTGAVMEVGCDNGYFLQHLRDRGCSVAGIEPDGRRADLAERRLGIQIERCTLEARPPSTELYDVVYHDDLLAHFRDPTLALRKMVSMLRPGGVLAFEVGLLGGVSPMWYRIIGSLHLEHHLYLYSRDSLRLLLDRADVDVVHESVFGLGPTVVLMKLAGGLRRIIATALPSSARWLDRALHRLRAFCRYRVGAVVPRVGPSTLLIVAKPRKERR